MILYQNIIRPNETLHFPGGRPEEPSLGFACIATNSQCRLLRITIEEIEPAPDLTAAWHYYFNTLP